MNVSSELIYAITRNGNSFLRKNLDRVFTADSFNASTSPAAGQCGFYTKKAVSLKVAADKTQVEVSKLVRKSKVIRKGKKHAIKSKVYKFNNKVVKAFKAATCGCPVLLTKVAKLAQAAKRVEKLSKKNN